MPTYTQVEEEQIWEALELLNDRLGVQRIFQSLPTIDLHSDLRCLVELQCAIVCVLQVVEATALALLQIYMDCLVEEEDEEEQMGEMVNNVVDTGHGVDNGEDFNYDGNLGL